MRRHSVVWATLLFLVAHHSVEGNLLVNGGFETVVPIPTDMPTAYGYWSHDVASIVGPENGITPFSGSRMLRFIYTAPYGPSASGVICEPYQIVDVSARQAMIETGSATAVADAWVNRGDITNCCGWRE